MPFHIFLHLLIFSLPYIWTALNSKRRNDTELFYKVGAIGWASKNKQEIEKQITSWYASIHTCLTLFISYEAIKTCYTNMSHVDL